MQVCAYALSLLLIAGAGKNIYYTAIPCSVPTDARSMIRPVSCAELHARTVFSVVGVFVHVWSMYTIALELTCVTGYMWQHI